MRSRGIDERLIHAVASHGYLLTVDVKPEHEMEKVLFAADEAYRRGGARPSFEERLRPRGEVGEEEV